MTTKPTAEREPEAAPKPRKRRTREERVADLKQQLGIETARLTLGGIEMAINVGEYAAALGMADSLKLVLAELARMNGQAVDGVDPRAEAEGGERG